jgi:hypothetical protein
VVADVHDRRRIVSSWSPARGPAQYTGVPPKQEGLGSQRKWRTGAGRGSRCDGVWRMTPWMGRRRGMPASHGDPDRRPDRSKHDAMGCSEHVQPHRSRRSPATS